MPFSNVLFLFFRLHCVCKTFTYDVFSFHVYFCLNTQCYTEKLNQIRPPPLRPWLLLSTTHYALSTTSNNSLFHCLTLELLPVLNLLLLRLFLLPLILTHITSSFHCFHYSCFHCFLLPISSFSCFHHFLPSFFG